MDPVLQILGSSFSGYWWVWPLTAVAAYLIGSINPAVIITKIATKGKVDIRTVGSGNAGFTNVLRAVGKFPAILTLILDALKCAGAVYFGAFLFSLIPNSQGDPVYSELVVNIGKYLAGTFCILGHSYPLYFGFKGGKGVVTAAALMLTEDWRVFLLILGTFLLIFLISRIISLASITCAAMYAPYTFLATFVLDRIRFGNQLPSMAYVFLSTGAALMLGLFVIIKHKDNIGRLIRGEEKKLKAKK